MICMKRACWLFVIAPLLAGGCSGGGTAAGGGGDPKRPVTLRVNLKAGEKQTQTTDTTVSGTVQGKSISSQSRIVIAQEVVSVAGGKFAVKSTIQEATATGANADSSNAKLAQLKGKSFTVTVDDRGRVLDMGGADKDPMLGQMLQSAKFGELPEKPIKPGDKWSVNAEMMGMQMTAEMTSEGTEMVNGREALRVGSSMKIPVLPDPIKSTTWFDVATGTPIKMESSNKMNFMGADVTTKTTMIAK